MGPTAETCAELLQPLRALLGLKQVALQKRLEAENVPYAASGLLTELVHRGECRASDLAHHRIVDASVVSRQVGQLESAGLISRRPDPADKRVSLLRATTDGERAVSALEARKAEWIGEALRDWDDAEVHELARLLDSAMHDIRRHTIQDGACDPVNREGNR
jgi:DNA-binding MarR family transcriptional regulator